MTPRFLDLGVSLNRHKINYGRGVFRWEYQVNLEMSQAVK